MSRRKERSLRPARFSCLTSSAFLLPALALVLLFGTGCELTGDLTKGFFDPAEVGRYKKDPLLMPILNSLDTGIEEPNEEFTQAVDVQQTDLVASSTDYVIGRNDLVNVSITDLVGPGIETVKTARVSESGKLSLPLIGQIQAEGLTESQLEQSIIEAYRRNNIIQNAQVSVTVAEARARTFSVLGAVARPGQYQILQSDFRILDALVLAGDVTSIGIDYLYVVRREDYLRGQTGTGAGTGTNATNPAATQPTDILAPRSDAGSHHYRKSMLLQTSGTGTGAAASTPPATGATGTGDGRYIIVDGKPVLVGNQGTSTNAAGATDNLAPAGTTPPAAATGAAPTTQGSFQFSNPMGEGNVRIIRVPLTELKNGELKYNIVVRPQDLIMVPFAPQGEYYMDGHVNRTGVYSLTARKIDLMQAMASAGGFDQLGVPARTEIIRRIGKDKKVYTTINLDKVFAGQQPDIYLKPNDVVRVGTTALSPFIAAVRNGFRITYGFGFLYDRNYAPQQPNG
jgi:polysaccharide export outer membrane protein